jgi:DNA polymerase-4
MDKPRGFAVIGMKNAAAFLRDKKVGIIRGAGKVLETQLNRDGFMTIGDLQDAAPRDLANRYGATGLWLARIARAEDSRAVDPGGEMKSISSETTFNTDLSAYAELEAVLWRQAERVSARAKAKGLAGRTVVLKLKTANFRLRTRSASLEAPTQLADRIFRTAKAALKREADGTKFRLLGVGITNLGPASEADPGSLIDPDNDKRAAAERAMDRIRAKFGGEAVGKGRGLNRKR